MNNNNYDSSIGVKNSQASDKPYSKDIFTNSNKQNTSPELSLPKPLSKNYINITDIARIKILEMLSNKKDCIGLKIGLKQKGCTGMMYNIEFAKQNANITKYDDRMDFEGFSIFVDPKISIFIISTTMDYIETDAKSGFEFINPNEKGKCGCGESFYV